MRLNISCRPTTWGSSGLFLLYSHGLCSFYASSAAFLLLRLRYHIHSPSVLPVYFILLVYAYILYLGSPSLSGDARWHSCSHVNAFRHRLPRPLLFAAGICRDNNTCCLCNFFGIHLLHADGWGPERRKNCCAYIAVTETQNLACATQSGGWCRPAENFHTPVLLPRAHHRPGLPVLLNSAWFYYSPSTFSLAAAVILSISVRPSGLYGRRRDGWTV